jgi:hypothetical protein
MCDFYFKNKIKDYVVSTLHFALRISMSALTRLSNICIGRLKKIKNQKPCHEGYPMN